MISYKTTACRGFVLCVGSGLNGDVFTQPNQGDGVAIQYAYAYKGHGTVTNGGMSDTLAGKELLDLTKYMGREVRFTMLGDPTMWVAVNPVPDTVRFDAVLHNGAKTFAVQGAEKRKAVVCLEGNITCNSATVSALKYVSIKQGDSVTVTVPEDAVALVLTTR
jgi:redox-sensitive bicupin YhaK (pirin superfamily)